MKGLALQSPLASLKRDTIYKKKLYISKYGVSLHNRIITKSFTILTLFWNNYLSKINMLVAKFWNAIINKTNYKAVSVCKKKLKQIARFFICCNCCLTKLTMLSTKCFSGIVLIEHLPDQNAVLNHRLYSFLRY